MLSSLLRFGQFDFRINFFEIFCFDKGGIISKSFPLWLKSPKMGAKSLSCTSFSESVQCSDLAPIFRDLSLSEKLSKIKPPLILSWFDSTIFRAQTFSIRFLFVLFNSSWFVSKAWKRITNSYTMEDCHRIGILFPKLIWSTVRKNMLLWLRKTFEILGWRGRICKWLHYGRLMQKWYIVSKIVLTYYEKNLWNSWLKAENFQNYWYQ